MKPFDQLKVMSEQYGPPDVIDGDLYEFDEDNSSMYFIKNIDSRC